MLLRLKREDYFWTNFVIIYFRYFGKAVTILRELLPSKVWWRNILYDKDLPLFYGFTCLIFSFLEMKIFAENWAIKNQLLRFKRTKKKLF